MFKSIAFAAVSVTSVQAITEFTDNFTCTTTVKNNFFQLKDLASANGDGYVTNEIANI